MFYYGDVTPVGVFRAEAVEEEAAVACQREAWIRLSVFSKVDRERPLSRSHLLADRCIVEPELSRELALDGSGTLELVVDVNAEAPTSLFEFSRNVGRPLGRMRSELTHLSETEKYSLL